MQTTDRPTLLVGRTERVARDRLEHDALRPGSALKAFDEAGHAITWLEQGEPHAVAVDLPPEEAEQFVLSLRAIPRLTRVPVVVLTDDVSDLSFAQVYAWGADDLVAAADMDGLSRRLRSIPADLPLERPAHRGRAVLAHGDQRQRVLIARVLRYSGFDVRFVIDAEELPEAAVEDGNVLVVADAQLHGGGAAPALRRAREQGSETPWIVMAPPKSLVAVSSDVGALGPIAVHDAFAPPENLHFVTNEIMSRSFSEQRASARLLFGTLIGFRVAGRDRDRYGYSYNISGEGLYVRTLDPLARGDDAWLEFTPPRTDRRVRLEARVAWSRALGPAGGATVPPGFGVQLTGGSSSDLERYRKGYRAFAHDIAGVAWSTRPGAAGTP